MLKIVDRLEKETNDLLKSNDSNVRIQIDANAQKQLAEDGYEPTMGARPLKRLFEEKIKKPLSKKILFGNDDGIVTVQYNDNEGYYFT